MMISKKEVTSRNIYSFATFINSCPKLTLIIMLTTFSCATLFGTAYFLFTSGLAQATLYLSSHDEYFPEYHMTTVESGTCFFEVDDFGDQNI